MLKKYLYVFFISMVPIIELRGAVPIGTAMGLPWHWTLIVSIVGNCVPVPFILLFINAILKWMRGCKVKLFVKISNWLYEKAEKNREKIEKNMPHGDFTSSLRYRFPAQAHGQARSSLPFFGMSKKKRR